MLRESASTAGAEVTPAVVNKTITQEIKAPDTGNSVLLNDVLSDSDEERMSDDEDIDAEPSDEDILAKDIEDASIEFRSVFKQWKRYTPDWLKIYPSLNDRGINLSIIDDFMALDLKPMIDDIKKENKAGKFGYLPLMMGCSVGQESFAERVNSAAKLLVDNKNTALADNLIDQLVVLRMNRSFMEFMRSHKHAHDGLTIVPGLDNSN